MSDIRLLLTNDIFGAFFPREFSWGTQPGARALVHTVDRLREGARTSVWIDGGDFSAGGPLAPASVGGQLGWAAAAELPIDAAVPGNHEFDYGDAAMLDNAANLPFPLIAADVDDTTLDSVTSLLLDHLTLSSPSGRSVAIVGLCFPERRGLRVYYTTSDLAGAAVRIRDIATDLRRDADHVVVVMHEGFGLYPGLSVAAGNHDVVTRIESLRNFCDQLNGVVDAVVGGHTLGRYVGHVGQMPFVQPWALGVEVGVLDFDNGDVSVSSRPVSPAWAAPWTGPGADVEAKLRGVVVGAIDHPLLTRANCTGSRSLTQRVAEGLLESVGCDVAIVHPDDTATQIGVDGTLGYLQAGPVTEADVLQTIPWDGEPHGDAVLVADLSAGDITTVVAGFGSLGLPVGCARRRDDDGGSVALVSRYTTLANTLLDRDISWSPTGCSQRDGLRLAVSRNATG